MRSLVACAPGSGSQSAVSRVPTVSPPAPPCRWPASCQLPRMRSGSSRSQSGSREHTGFPGSARCLVARAPGSPVSVRSLAGALCESARSPRAGGCRFPAPERGGSLPLPFIFRYLCPVSRLPASYLNTQRWRCSFVEIQMYLPASQADSVVV